MSYSYGKNVRVTVFGQSHAAGIGCVVDGLPAGVAVDMDKVNAFMARRRPGQNAWSTKRRETDEPEILSGLVDGKTCGAPLAMLIRNSDQRSGDYKKLADVPRPSHADFTAYVKYEGQCDMRGGGPFSGRMTAPLCFAGAVAAQVLAKWNVRVGAHLLRVGGVEDEPVCPMGGNEAALLEAAGKDFPTLSQEAAVKMQQEIEKARLEADSVGGVVEAAAYGLPIGLGQPMMDGVESRIASLLFSVPAVRGVEFGSGFGAADMRGSRHNDPFAVQDGHIVTTKNDHGGVLGGITSGMPLVVRAAFKPTPSIGQPQQSVNLKTMQPETLVIGGRHDPCIAPRAVPVVEAALCIALLDMMMD